jgi:hypothetical protein
MQGVLSRQGIDPVRSEPENFLTFLPVSGS